MVLGVIAGIRDLSDSELSALALAVATEQSRREAAAPVPPPPEAAPVTEDPAGEPPPPAAEPVVFTTRYGTVWHRTQLCPHLQTKGRVRHLFAHATPPENLRQCKTCELGTA